MGEVIDTRQLAAELRASLGGLVRRIRANQVDGELTMPESSAMARLDRGGPAASSDLARAEQISPQSMGTTLAGLEARGLVRRQPDPTDGRRVLLSLSPAGNKALGKRRSAKVESMARALTATFTPEELAQLQAAAPLLARLAEAL